MEKIKHLNQVLHTMASTGYIIREFKGTQHNMKKYTVKRLI